MKVVIMGCGRVGARLAMLMQQDGHDISIIDSDPESFKRLPEEFTGETVLGTGIDVDVLKAAGIENADAFAAVTNADNTNIMACEVAKEIFGVEQVLARIYDPGREDLYHELGLETVCPTTLISTTVRNILTLPGSHAPMKTAPLALSGNGEQPAAASTNGPASAPLLAETLMPVQPQPETPSAPNASKEKERTGLRGLFRS